MNSQSRQQFLKIAAIACAGLYLADLLVLEPAIQHWKEQKGRIAALQEKVQRGRQILDRRDQLQQRWAKMVRANLPAEVSAAENVAYTAVGRWARESRIAGLNSITPQWQGKEEGFETYECRVTATGDQASLGRFIYEMETDPLPVNLEDCELAARDAQGTQLTLTARVTFLRLKEPQEPKNPKEPQTRREAK